MGQSTRQAAVHYRTRAGQAQGQVDRYRAMPGHETSVALYERERDQWLALADELDTYLLRTAEAAEEVVSEPTEDDVALF